MTLLALVSFTVFAMKTRTGQAGEGDLIGPG